MASKKTLPKVKGQAYSWFEEPVYDVTLIFIKGGTCEEAIKVLDYLDVTYEPHSGDAQSWYYAVDSDHQKKGYVFSALWWDGKDLSHLTHEITHLVLSVFKDKSIEICYENQETIAYYVGYWTKTLLGKSNLTS
jgi:hypothetical protein